MLKNLFKRLFDAPVEPGRWLEILKWWELRRLVYNLWVFVLCVAGGAVFVLSVHGWFDFLTVPFFLLVGVFLFAVMANLCYTAGWLIETVAWYVGRYRPRTFRRVLFSTGMIIAALVSLGPGLFAFVAMALGEPLESPYYRYTKTQPDPAALVGRYWMTDDTYGWKMIRGAELDSVPTIQLMFDGSFTYRNLPAQYDTVTWKKSDGSKYESIEYAVFADRVWERRKTKFISGIGTWQLNDSDRYGRYTITLSFDTVVTMTNTPYMNFESNELKFNLRNQRPPYELYYLIGDPDTWSGAVFVKE